MVRRVKHRSDDRADGAKWFAAKGYGYGAGFPVAWQGWAVIATYLVVTIGAGLLFQNKPAAAAAILVPATIILIVTAARTTRGGWRWRWGEKS